MKPKDWRNILLIILVTVSVFSNIIENRFLYTEKDKIMDNPFIKSWRWTGYVFNSGYTKYFAEKTYRPVLTLSYFLNYSYAKLNFREWHIFNILLHIINIILVYFLGRRLFGNVAFALFSALFFAVCPVQSKTLSVISYRDDLLFSLFLLSSLLIYLKFRENKNILYLIVSLGSFIVATFCDLLALALPLLVLLYEYCFKPVPEKRKPVDNNLKILCFGIGFSIITSLPNWFSLQKDINHHFYLPVLGVGISIMAVLTFLETKFKIKHYYMYSMLVVILLISGSYTFVHNRRDWKDELKPDYADTDLNMGTNYFVLGDTQTAFQYWDKAIAVRPGKVTDLVKKSKELYFTRGGMKAKNLIEYTLKYPQSGAEAYGLLAATYFDQKDYTQAVIYAKKAIELDSIDVLNDFPNLQALYYQEIGKEYFFKQDYDMARKMFLEAISLNPRFISAHQNLGVTYYSKKMYAQAIDEFEKVLLIRSNDIEAMISIGVVYLAKQDFNQCIDWFNRVIAIKPDSIRSLMCLTKAYYGKK